MASPGMPTTLRADRLDREAELFLRFASPLVGQPISHEKVSKFRRSWRLLAATYGRRVPVASIVERRIDGPGGQITLRVYTPEGPAGLRPAFLWCHGGGCIPCAAEACKDAEDERGADCRQYALDHRYPR